MTIDIMMPFYGRFDHFRAAVESVLAQHDPDWRLTIVDDVYPDPEPGRWANAIDDPRVSYIRNDVNLGVSANYRKCVDLMQSEYAVMMGCDDVMLPGYVGRVRELVAKHPGVAVVQPGVVVIDGEGSLALPLADRVKGWYRHRGIGPRELAGEDFAASILRANWTYFPSLCWRVAVIKKHGFRLDLDVVQDMAMLLTIARTGGRLLLDDEVVFRYRRHAASVSAFSANDGSRFAQERLVFFEAQRDFAAIGWMRASRTAGRYLTSRLNALVTLPAAVKARNRDGSRALVRHIAGSAPRS